MNIESICVKLEPTAILDKGHNFAVILKEFVKQPEIIKNISHFTIINTFHSFLQCWWLTLTKQLRFSCLLSSNYQNLAKTKIKRKHNGRTDTILLDPDLLSNHSNSCGSQLFLKEDDPVISSKIPRSS